MVTDIQRRARRRMRMTVAPAPIVEETICNVHRVMDTNVQGMFLCLRCEILAMRATGGAPIANTSSLAGLVGSRKGVYPRPATEWSSVWPSQRHERSPGAGCG
jgi:NAD(P)-dependent dehydrogenase (short-subunit alcohol dehydrogenase family)